MAHISEFKSGDSISFVHKGVDIEAVVEKINSRTVKATATNDVKWYVRPAFGRPSHHRQSRPGTRWTLNVMRDGTVGFRHVDATKADVSSSNDRKALAACVHACIKGGMDAGEVLALVAAEVVK